MPQVTDLIEEIGITLSELENIDPAHISASSLKFISTKLTDVLREAQENAEIAEEDDEDDI